MSELQCVSLLCYFNNLCCYCIAGRTSLEALSFGGNPIGDYGISLMSNELQSNSILTELRIYECGISSKGTSKTKHYIICKVIF